MTTLSVRARHRVEGFELDVELEAPPGVTVLFGPSGSGKSTTLSAVAGLLRPREGRVALGDDVWLDTAARTRKPVHERRVAYVFQSLALFPHMTAEENVAYGMDRSRSDRMQTARKLLERFRVGHLVGRSPGTFSGGEAQRVALARAFAMQPRVVLMDEPFSALDEKLRGELLEEVKALVGELDVPALFVTHHRGEARMLAERVVVFSRGKIAAKGGLEALDHADSGYR
jgi:molybdate transport system ATP-binding protein